MLKTEAVSPIHCEFIVANREELTRSPSLDRSLDEGVKASTTRQTMQISPRTSKTDFAQLAKKQVPPKSEIRVSLVAKSNQANGSKA